MKFDGVSGNKDKELEDPKGYGAIEYAYSLMARAAGITMSECQLLEENDRRHFITKRFDRPPGGGKLHAQSLCALAPALDVTYSFNPSGRWTAQHQMSINGKRDEFTLDDFRACSKSAMMKRGRGEKIIEEVCAAVAQWPEHADKAQVSAHWREQR